MEQFTAYVLEGKAQWINFSQNDSRVLIYQKFQNSFN